MPGGSSDVGDTIFKPYSILDGYPEQCIYQIYAHLAIKYRIQHLYVHVYRPTAVSSVTWKLVVRGRRVAERLLKANLVQRA